MALTSTKGRVPTGYADEIVISHASFKSLHRGFEHQQQPPSKKRKREGRGDAGVVYGDGAYKGPWARYEARRPDADSDVDSKDSDVEIVYEEESEDEPSEMPLAKVKPSKKGTAYEENGDGQEKTQFLGSEEHDYLGRTYMHVPQDLDIDLRHDNPLPDRKNYVPKKLIHTWHQHTGPITQTRFFPDSGHLLLSASADSKILLWDVYHGRELLRAYNGHNKSVCDIDFVPDGRSFLSASYDRKAKLWDTETGACLGRYSTGATPHVVRINPGSPSEFIAGMSDKKIVQFDTRTPDPNKPTQEYDHHLGAINTLTFCDENRRFLSTSDDKSLRAWEYNIPVPIKFVASPEMYALTRSTMHPSGKYVAYQSADNQVVVYNVGEKFKQNRRKVFMGANSAGYAIDVSISPSGEFIASGDSAGSLCFWDWKTCKLMGKLEAGGSRKGATVSVDWHPRETSKVVSGGLDGSLRYWD
ncbi:MAG: hypothetical protein M1828_003151 [Chrysothrix sp. TS-e1954]|nr:MAG: hypothetical protein M1828_003151 [Chrysothrix sp. TS-e1954]